MNDPTVAQAHIYQDRYVTEMPADNHSPDYDQWDPYSQSSEPDAHSTSAKNLEGLQEGQAASHPSDADLFSDLEASDIPEGYWDGVEDSFNTLKEISGLKTRVQDSSNLSQEDKSQLLQEISELESTLEGLSSENAEEKIMELQDRIEFRITEVGMDRDSKINSLERELEKLSDDKLDNPFLSDSKLEKFSAQIEALKSQLSLKDLDMNAFSQEVESLSDEVNHSIKKGELLEKFKDLPNSVTTRGKFWESTQAFSLDVVHALDSGDWSKVNQFLTMNITNGNKKQKAELGDKNHRSDAYRVVQQFVGTLFHRLAEGDQEKLDAFLNLIPKDTRQTMIGAIDRADKDLYSRKYVKGEGEAASMGYYGTPVATADRIRQSLDWNEALFFDGEALPPRPDQPGEIPADI